MSIVRHAFVAALAAGNIAGAGAWAQAGNEPAADHIRQVVIYGNDPCPRGSGEEVVVCARRPDNQRFRIPKSLREEPSRQGRQSWSVNASDLARIGDTGIQSCSTVGSGGGSGCWTDMARQSRDARRNPPPQ